MMSTTQTQTDSPHVEVSSTVAVEKEVLIFAEVELDSADIALFTEVGIVGGLQMTETAPTQRDSP